MKILRIVTDSLDRYVAVQAGELTGVALVTEPAVRSARVSEVAATEGEEVAEEISDSTVEEEVTPTTEGDEVDNTVTNAETVETVEAAQSATVGATVILGISKVIPASGRVPREIASIHH